MILDTNVLSELIKPVPDQHVNHWLDAQPALERRLPEGRRKNMISTGIDKLLYEVLDGLIEAFDTSAANQYADVVTMREQQGRPIEIPDAQPIRPNAQ